MKNKNKIKIKVNGKNLSIDQNSTVFSLSKKLNMPLNEKIIDKKKLRNITLKNKDILEIVHFIGGG